MRMFVCRTPTCGVSNRQEWNSNSCPCQSIRLNSLRALSPFLLCWLLSLQALGQWMTQTVTLQPGWNSVFLQVQPEPRDCVSLFSNLPIESVWAWNRQRDQVQYIQDPANFTAASPDWLVFFPAQHPLHSQRTLHAIHAARSYLIKLPASSSSMNWTIRGIPTVTPIRWIPDSLNLVGFPIGTADSLTFDQLFANSPAHNREPVFRLSPSGHWERVSDLTTARPRPSEAFWIRSRSTSQFQGPVQIDLDQQTQLDFGRLLVEQTVRIKNLSSTSKTVIVTPLPSAAPPPDSPPLAGPVPLLVWRNNPAQNETGWFPLSSTRADLAPGEHWDLRLSISRRDMIPLTSTPGARFQSLLEVADSNSAFRQSIPVSADGLQSSSPAVMTLRSLANSPSPSSRRAGLWIGNVSLNQVSQPASSQPDLPVPTASDFSFRILLHVDAAGQVRFLQKILQMWKPGTYKSDPSNPTQRIVDQPGRFVLLTDEALAAQFTGAALRDGDAVARRYSSAAFGFSQPILMSGNPDFDAAGLAVTVVSDYNDPLNPFKHLYHPDHDNLDERFERVLPEGRESFTVRRLIQLQFSPVDPQGLTLSGWGDSHLGGSYRETIVGLHKSPIHLQGVFRLHHASRIASLNDAN